MAAPVLQFKRGLLANLPGLRAGEPGFTTDSYDLYVGIDSSTNNNKFFGSHRYWTKNTASTGSGVNLVEGTTNGTSYLTLKAPDSLSGIGTYVFPDTTDGSTGDFLKLNSYANNIYTLEWAPVPSGSFTITGDTGTDTFTTGETLTFAGTANEIETAVTNNQVQIGLPNDVTIANNFKVSGISTFVGAVTFEGGTITLGDAASDNVVFAADVNSNIIPNTDATYNLGNGSQRWNNASFAGIVTAATGAVVDGVQIGINGANVIDTVSGNLTLNSAGGQTIIDDAVVIQNNLNVTGSVTIGGTSILLTSEEVFIKNRDIVLGYTTSLTNADVSNDDTANHGGVAIASTIGSPLVSFSASGINTLPDTYKQMMWFKSGTLGFATDTFAFNYGVAIGTTTMANGVRLAVGSGITATDNSITATSFVGNLTGTASTATAAATAYGLSGTPNITVGTVNASSINVSGLSTFVGDAVFQSNVNLGNQDYLRFGASNELEIGYDNSGGTTFVHYPRITSNISSRLVGFNIDVQSPIAFTKGDIFTGEYLARFIPDGEAELYHNGVVKFETTGVGATVFGTLESQQINVSGVTTSSGGFVGNVTGNATGLSGTPNITVGAVNASSINVSGLSTFVGNAVFQGHASFGDQDEIRVGASDDLKIVHTASGAPFDRNRIISSVTSSNVIGLAIESAGGAIAFTKGEPIFGGGETIAKFIPDGAVELYYDNSKKFETSGIGVTVTGTLVSQQINVSGVTTTGTLVLNGTPGVAITAISSSTTLAENSNAYLPTQAAVKAYVDAVDVTTGIAGDTGSGSVSTSQTLTIAGTAGEIETSASSQTITVGLPNDVIVGTSLSAPTVKTATLQHRNGTQAATIDTSGNITASQNLTISGNLYVNGSTTQVNTSSMTVEDRTIELGQVDGSTPSSATTWDLGVLFNYNASGAKKSAVIWEHADGRFKFGSQVTDGGGTDNDSPQITVSNYAAIEIGSLWVNDCAGQSQVINCSGSTRTLENITIDAGTF